MKTEEYIIGVLALLLIGCSPYRPEVELPIQEAASMPGGGRASATCFVVNDRAYVFAGRDSAGTYHNDLWRYTPATDQWENLGSTPLVPRVNATACVDGDIVYLGLGYNGGHHGQDTSYLQDWWAYTPSTDSWQQLQDYPNAYTDAATSFVGQGELYVGFGFCWNYRRDMFRYTITDNRWDSIDVGVSFSGYPTRSFGGTGCTCAGRHFMGTGYHRFSLDWWAELVDGTHWEARAAVPGRTRTTAASGASADAIYLCGGFHYGGVTTTGEVLQDMLRYNPQEDRWHYIAVMPKRLMNHICFAIGDRVYFGLGEDDEWRLNDKLYYLED